jgi:tau tubulin kinase
MLEVIDPDQVVVQPDGAKPAVVSPFLIRGDIVRDRYQVLDKIGQGAFGEIYAGLDLKPPAEDVAIKCELIDNKKMVLRLEVMALKCLQSCPHVVRYITSGRHNNTINYLVMERLGKNLADVRKETAQGEFDFVTSIRLAINMQQAIEGVHELGYIHRDIKPSNFVMGKGENHRRCYLIDFGLARKYRTDTGEIRPARVKAGFRGTTRYASVASHQGKELGRVDDLWSLFYLLVEFVLRELPWRRKKEKDDILAIKESKAATLVDDLPEEFRLYQNHLSSLGYEDAPNYSYLRALLHSILEKRPMSIALSLESTPGAVQSLPRGQDSARGQSSHNNSRKKSLKMRTEATRPGMNDRDPNAGMVSEGEPEEDVPRGDTPLTKPTGQIPGHHGTPRMATGTPRVGATPQALSPVQESREGAMGMGTGATYAVGYQTPRDSVGNSNGRHPSRGVVSVMKADPKKNGCKCIIS